MSRDVTIAWSDPRLPETMTQVADMDIHHGTVSMDDWLVVWSLAQRGQGPEGTWTGSVTGFVEAEHRGASLGVLTGDGVNEGLSLILRGEDVGDAMTFEGYMIEGDLPPMP